MNADAITRTESVGHYPSINRKSQEVKSSGLTKAEDTVIARLKRGDEEAFDELVNQHHGALIRITMGYVPDREVAEEVVQDTWMAVIQSLNRFEGDRKSVV